VQYLYVREPQSSVKHKQSCIEIFPFMYVSLNWSGLCVRFMCQVFVARCRYLRAQRVPTRFGDGKIPRMLEQKSRQYLYV